MEPVLLTVTYNEDQVKFLIQKAMDFAITLRVYVPIDDKNSLRKIQYIGLTPQQVRHIWQAKLQVIKLKVTTEDDTEIEIEVNIEGLMVDKKSADTYIEVESKTIEPSDPIHISNIPSISALTKYNQPNPYDIKLTWREVATLKKDISGETTASRRKRIKERVAKYMQLLADQNPKKKLIIEIIHAQETAIRKNLGIKGELPTQSTYERYEREERR